MSHTNVPTIKVKHLESDDELIINKEDFDATLHEKIEPAARAVLKEDKAAKGSKGKPKKEEEKPSDEVKDKDENAPVTFPAAK